MDIQKLKVRRSFRRKHRVRKAIHGTATKPRLSVHRTNFHIYAQLIDDDKCVTLASASSNDKGTSIAYGGNIAGARQVGLALAEKARAIGVSEAAFDRGAFRFHGRVKALARAATESGLKCTGLEEIVKKVKKVEAGPKAKKKKPEKAGA